MLTILFDGIAYGMLLFILAVGLSVTMGLMNFINLAHGAFAMAGGYITVVLMQRFGVPFLVCLPIAFAGAALLGAVLERTLYRPALPPAPPGPGAVLHRPDLHGRGRDRLLHGIHPADHAVARLAARPHRDRRRLADAGHGPLPLFIIAVCAALTIALQYVLARTRFGSRLRASVDDQRVAAGLGINVNVVFLTTFAFGSGLPAWAGRWAPRCWGLDPTFPLKFMIYFLIVVAVGGTSSITGAACWPRCCWALPTWRASTTSPSWARSSCTA
jgi:branched-chain amino acid transport system permease protein